MIMTHEGHHDLSSWIVHVLHKYLRECLCKSCPVDFSWDTDFARFLCVVRHSWVKFPHSPILHYAFSSWIEKTMTKQYIAIRKTDLFYNSMGLCGNFTHSCTYTKTTIKLIGSLYFSNIHGYCVCFLLSFVVFCKLSSKVVWN